jgi:hypothetical protein
VLWETLDMWAALLVEDEDEGVESCTVMKFWCDLHVHS